MDSITQAALGAAIGEEILGKKLGGKGAIIGAIIATIPDLDIVLFPLLSPLERLSMHRGFSHSILFGVLAPWVIAYVLSKVKWTKDINYLRLVLFSFLCLITHMVLDAFTSYGTLLYLPFTDTRVGVDSINVVDPVYTLPLLFGLIASLWVFRKSQFRPWFNRVGLLLSTVYLLSTVGIKSTIEEHFQSALNEQQIEYSDLMSQPVGIASARWYAVARSQRGIYIGNYSILDAAPITFTFFSFNNELLDDLDPHLVDRMKWFAKGYYHVFSEDGVIKFYNMQVDMQGIQKLDNRLAPTKGFFTIIPNRLTGYKLGSGRHKS